MITQICKQCQVPKNHEGSAYWTCFICESCQQDNQEEFRAKNAIWKRRKASLANRLHDAIR